MQLSLFNGINVMGLVANIWFVPLVSWCVVPAILLLFLVPIKVVQQPILYTIDRVIDIGLNHYLISVLFGQNLSMFPIIYF